MHEYVAFIVEIIFQVCTGEKLCSETNNTHMKKKRGVEKIYNRKKINEKDFEQRCDKSSKKRK